MTNRFSELARHGSWTVSPAEYVAAVRRYRDEIGGLEWGADAAATAGWLA